MNGRPDPDYRESIRLAASRRHNGPFFDGPVYSRIVWFHKGSAHQGDVDNIAKRIHDALKQLLFADDNAITHTMSIRVDVSLGVDLVSEPYPDRVIEITGMLADPAVQNVLYIEVGNQIEREIYLGPVH